MVAAIETTRQHKKNRIIFRHDNARAHVKRRVVECIANKGCGGCQSMECLSKNREFFALGIDHLPSKWGAVIEVDVEEKAKAEIILWSIEQKKHFHEKENSVHGLQVVRGDDEVLRVKTRIIERDDDLSFLYPILLPSKHYLTECLIREYHLKYCHAGVQILAAKLRLQYWIFSSKRNIRSCVSRCVVCKRFTAKALTTPPIQLPLDRVRESAIFEITGIDLCGPLLLKPRGKAWIVLFTCAVYRAIHLEPLTSLSTESFMQTLRRFIARRGRPSTAYTDNATNFRGTDNALKKIDWQKISQNECYPIKCKFNPPTAAWWWERLIRSVKSLLVRILGRSSVNFEELLTILCDVEASINSRPLTYISDDSDELIPLTPSLFLQDIKQVGVASNLLTVSNLFERYGCISRIRVDQSVPLKNPKHDQI
ncbi:endonuclease [Caerostris darwini]|uniref:Endonuclease n=1 Tax=Caerostris darwini TaxID=1538125 RepID=A0AAV4MF42_9ARAC|nr:endonuclease [Caerostris darwini]